MSSRVLDLGSFGDEYPEWQPPYQQYYPPTYGSQHSHVTCMDIRNCEFIARNHLDQVTAIDKMSEVTIWWNPIEKRSYISIFGLIHDKELLRSYFDQAMATKFNSISTESSLKFTCFDMVTNAKMFITLRFNDKQDYDQTRWHMEQTFSRAGYTVKKTGKPLA